jgi:hypothetical protein
MEARVASNMKTKATPVRTTEGGKKIETRESPAAILEKVIKRTKGRSGW